MVRRLVIALMDPGVGSILDAFQYGQCLVFGSKALDVGIFIQDAGPQDGSAPSWSYVDIKIAESSLTTFLDIVLVQKQGEDSNSLCTIVKGEIQGEVRIQQNNHQQLIYQFCHQQQHRRTCGRSL
jgi:hypothetical protein